MCDMCACVLLSSLPVYLAQVFAFFSGQEASMSSVTAMARLFYRWRVSIVSLYLVNNATQGVLQGVDCVRAAAAIASTRAVLDVMATVAALGIGGALFDSSDGQSAIGDGGDAYVLGLVGAAMAVSAGMSMLVALVAVAIRVKGMRDWTNWRSGGKLQGEVSEFATDGVSMFVRTALLQGTFLIALACVCRLGAAATAAHAVILQLWSLGSFSVDGFADAGTIIGSGTVYPWRAVPDDIETEVEVRASTMEGSATGSAGPIVVRLCETATNCLGFPFVLTRLRAGVLRKTQLTIVAKQSGFIPQGIVLEAGTSDAWFCDYVEVFISGMSTKRCSLPEEEDF